MHYAIDYDVKQSEWYRRCVKIMFSLIIYGLHVLCKAINLSCLDRLSMCISSLFDNDFMNYFIYLSSQQQQRIMSLETEIDGYKRSIQKEQENNEKLTLVLNKTDSDMTTVKRLLQQCHDKHDALKSEYSTYTRMLHETEQALNRANTVSGHFVLWNTLPS